MMEDLNNFPGIAEQMRGIEITAFFEQAVFADWRGSSLIPPGEDVITYIRENKRVFLNLERVARPGIRLQFS